MADQNDATFPVGASALTKFKLVKLSSNLLVVSAASTDLCKGIVASGYDANATEARVILSGKTFAEAHDGSIVKGDLLEAAAAGRVDTHSTTSTKPVIGVALESSSAQGDFIRIELFPQSSAGPAA